MSIVLYQPELLGSCHLFLKLFFFHEDFTKGSKIRLKIAKDCAWSVACRSFIVERARINEGRLLIFEILVLKVPEMSHEEVS